MKSIVSPDIRYRYTEQEYNIQTDVNNFRARVYDQSLGRFYATDPAGQHFSPFSYASNNPMSFVDPTGTTTQNGEIIEQQQRLGISTGVALSH